MAVKHSHIPPVFNEDSKPLTIDVGPSIDKAAKLVRTERAANTITKNIESDFNSLDNNKNIIKRNIDYENIESFLDTKYREVNKNDASEEFSFEDSFIQKRSYDFKNSIQKLEEAIEMNQIIVNSMVGIIDESDENALLISKDLNDVETEIKAMDEDIIGLLETAKMTDNTIHKRIRHKRETKNGVGSVAFKLFTPILEEKKREKRLVQEKLAEVREEFIQCKKSTMDKSSGDCDDIYKSVMEKFREITKKFREIEEIVDEMEHFEQPGRSADDDERKKKKDKKKKGKKSSESHESSEEKKKKKKKKTTTVSPPAPPSSTAENTSEVPTETTNVIETTTAVEEDIETTTTFEAPPGDEDSSENQVRAVAPSKEKTSRMPSPLIVQPEFLIDEESKKTLNSATDPTVKMAPTGSCPASAYNDDLIGHPKFQEDLEDSHAGRKFYENHASVDEIVAEKIERSQRGPFRGIIADFIENAEEAVDGTRNLIDDALKDTPQSAESKEVGSSKKSSKPSSDVIGASGPFIALCEQMAKQAKQAPPQGFDPQHGMVPVPLSGFANQPFPTTGETMKGSSKVIMNPGFNMMPYPVCFVSYPQYRTPQHQYYYPGLIPMTQPGGKVDKTQHDTIDPEFIRAANSRGA